MGDCVSTFTDLKFLFKFIALILNILNLIFWTIGNPSDDGMVNRSQVCCFAHTVPAFMVVLVGMVILYILGEVPGQWFQRLFIFTGIVLFFVTGIIGLINTLGTDRHTAYALIIAILCVVIGVLLLLDLLKNEGIF